MAMKQGELVPQIFKHPEFGEVRVTDNEGDVWYVGRDVATSLGYAKPADAVRIHVPDKYKGVFEIETPGGKQKVTFINEAGVYKLVLKSKMPKAEEFSDWLCADVAPSIRKTGVYMTTEAAEEILFNPDFIIGLAKQVKDARAERDAALAQVEKLKPKADYTEAVLISDERLTSELIAKEYGECAQWLNTTMGKLGKMFKRGRTWYMKALYAKKGYRVSDTVTLERGKTVVNHYWTQKGRWFIYNTLKAQGILPLKERKDPMLKKANVLPLIEKESPMATLF